MASAPSGPVLLVIIYVLIVLAASLIGARVYLRLVIQKQHLLASDYFMVAAWCSAFTTASFDVVMLKEGVLEPEIDYTLVNWEEPEPETIAYMLKIIWVAVLPFFTTFYLCKASLLAVYLQLFPKFMKTRRLLLWITIGYCAVAYLVSCGLQLFLCFPVQKNWAIDTPEDICSNDTLATVFQIAWSLHFVGSLALFGLPWLIIHKLNMRRKIKIGVYSIFLLGIVDIAFSLTRFLSVQLGNEGQFRSITTIELWSALDAYIGLIIACLPSLRPFLRRNRNASDKYSYDESARPARSTVTRRHDQSGFEEIDDDLPYTGVMATQTAPRSNTSPNPSQRDGWSDGKSNRSDVELVNINVTAPVKEQTHV